MRNRVKLHPKIPKEHVKFVRQQCDKLGLDCILKNGVYTLMKIGSKRGKHYWDEYMVKDGTVQIVGSDKHVALFIQNWKGYWFRTSPIISVKCNDGKIIIETENSIYQLS